MGQARVAQFMGHGFAALLSVPSLRAILIGLSLLLVFVSAATSVSGTISSNTTWSATDSPFQVTGNVTVATSTTLTIEAGGDREV